MDSRSKKKLGLAGLMAAVAAGLSYYHFYSGETVPDIEETKTVWYCTGCNRGFELKGNEFSTMVSRRPVEENGLDAERPSPRRAGGTFIEVAQCPDCNTSSGVRARRCPECGTIFRSRTEEGEIAACPDCAWSPVTNRKTRGR